MARLFLKIYVCIGITIIILNLIINIFSDETVQFLTNDDWLIFIIACGTLSIAEALEDNQ